MAILYLSRNNLNKWLEKITARYLVYLPTLQENKLHYKKIINNDFPEEQLIHKALQQIRASESLKGFFFNPKVLVGGLNKTTKIDIKIDTTPRIILGAKNCDLHPLYVHQKMYLENEYCDILYKSELERTIIIAADCPYPQETCFCNLVGLNPYPEKGADIIISALESGYLFETITVKGNELIYNNNQFFQEASFEDIKHRDLLREQAIKNLHNTNNLAFKKDIPFLIEQKHDEKFWQYHANSCVECFGCLMVCPTCFCFLLYDTPINDEGFKRYKIWDACYFGAYARVGGGMNTRPEFWKRFRNRFHCKFMNFKNDYNFFACSGCNRCYSVCMGKIDIRNILRSL